jgi:hypothetical protein
MDLLELAGEAASILEEHGLVVCARRALGVVTLDCVGVRAGRRMSFQFPVTTEDRNAERLAARVLAEMSSMTFDRNAAAGTIH